MPDATTDRPGRNEPCHCGSGQKYKRCCLKKDDETERLARSEAEAQETPPPAEQEAESEAARQRPATQQPWKRRGHEPAFQRFLTPDKRGGS